MNTLAAMRSLTVDAMLEAPLTEVCRCDAYPWPHQHMLGRCKVREAVKRWYCSDCNQPCELVRMTLGIYEGFRAVEDGRRLIADYFRPYAGSDCHGAPAYDEDWNDAPLSAVKEWEL